MRGVISFVFNEGVTLYNIDLELVRWYLAEDISLFACYIFKKTHLTSNKLVVKFLNVKTLKMWSKYRVRKFGIIKNIF